MDGMIFVYSLVLKEICRCDQDGVIIAFVRRILQKQEWLIDCS
jgi:hypothetical protein